MADKFTFDMLARLKSDCDYYLGHGHASHTVLWGKTPRNHCNEMRRLLLSIPEEERPIWLTENDIRWYRVAMDFPDGKTVALHSLAKSELFKKHLNKIPLLRVSNIAPSQVCVFLVYNELEAESGEENALVWDVYVSGIVFAALTEKEGSEILAIEAEDIKN